MRFDVTDQVVGVIKRDATSRIINIHNAIDNRARVGRRVFYDIADCICGFVKKRLNVWLDVHVDWICHSYFPFIKGDQ